MAYRSEGLQEKHPKVRHEVARDPVVGVVQQYFHGCFLGETLHSAQLGQGYPLAMPESAFLAKSLRL
jgi:hypothetical protein